jgi:hypothetical protein
MMLEGEQRIKAQRLRQIAQCHVLVEQCHVRPTMLDKGAQRYTGRKTALRSIAMARKTPA